MENDDINSVKKKTAGKQVDDETWVRQKKGVRMEKKGDSVSGIYLHVITCSEQKTP